MSEANRVQEDDFKPYPASCLLLHPHNKLIIAITANTLLPDIVWLYLGLS